MQFKGGSVCLGTKSDQAAFACRDSSKINDRANTSPFTHDLVWCSHEPPPLCFHDWRIVNKNIPWRDIQLKQITKLSSRSILKNMLLLIVVSQETVKHHHPTIVAQEFSNHNHHYHQPSSAIIIRELSSHPMTKQQLPIHRFTAHRGTVAAELAAWPLDLARLRRDWWVHPPLPTDVGHGWFMTWQGSWCLMVWWCFMMVFHDDDGNIFDGWYLLTVNYGYALVFKWIANDDW